MKNDHHDKQPLTVKILVNGKEYDVHPGRHLVHELKKLVKPIIPKEDILCVMIESEPKELHHESHCEVKGGECFASSCPSGGAA